MTEIKSLADKLRKKITAAEDGGKPAKSEPAPVKPAAVAPAESFPVLDDIRAYDNSGHKSMVHVRFDEKTLQTMNHFKIATGVDVTRLVAYAVADLFKRNPELKLMIKNYIQNFDL